MSRGGDPVHAPLGRRRRKCPVPPYRGVGGDVAALASVETLVVGHLQEPNPVGSAVPPAGAVPLVDAAECRVGGDASLVPCQTEQGLCLSPSGEVVEAVNRPLGAVGVVVPKVYAVVDDDESGSASASASAENLGNWSGNAAQRDVGNRGSAEGATRPPLSRQTPARLDALDSRLAVGTEGVPCLLYTSPSPRD